MSGVYTVVKGKKKEIKLTTENEKIVDIISEETGMDKNAVINIIVSAVTDDSVRREIAGYFDYKAREAETRAKKIPIQMRPCMYNKMDEYDNMERILRQ